MLKSRSSWLLLMLFACSEGTPEAPSADAGPPDSGGLADEDLGISGRVDAGYDAGINAGTDAGMDVGAPDSGRPPLQTGVEVRIGSGQVRGAEAGDLRVFKGIPFAEPPIGTRRFAPPVPVEPWSGTFEATEFGPSCPQVSLGPGFLLGDFAGPTSEDCLSLNVWAHNDERPRPVMVFIYGGGFVSGGSAWPIYEGARLARRADVVVVTINYRLGALGFLTTEALAAERGNDSAGNYGIQDQIEALRWVQQNITAFGGDSDKVTIFGESAGAISVCALLGAPSADALFHQAIIESGACVLATERGAGLPGTMTGSAMTGGAGIVETVGCNDAFDELDCLRSLPVESLVNASSPTAIFSGDLDALIATSPHIDGLLIPEQPLARIARGDADRPLITGSNEREGLLFAASDIVLTWTGLERAIEDFTGVDEATAEMVAALYPFGDFLTPGEAWIALLGDVSFICPGISAAAAAAPGAPSFTYHFTRSPLLARPIGAGHGIELFYVFDTFENVGLIPTQADLRVVEHLQRAWGDFAHFGAPSLEVGWPAFDPAQPSFAIIDDPPSLTDMLRNGRCESLKQLGLVQ